MKTLVIDSHKSSKRTPNENLHWTNANTIAGILGADFIWSYKDVNTKIRTGYDCIIFVHSSPYSFEDKAWLEQNPDAKLFFVTNEYNLGEPTILWKVAKTGRHYEVIANHPSKVSKIVEKYTSAWHNININSLCYSAPTQAPSIRPHKTIYYGSFRKGRIPYFRKWLGKEKIVVSTHAKNREKFRSAGCDGPFVDRVSFRNGDLSTYGYSLYIEDEKTHVHYNHLANRFYEALSNNVVPIFDSSCAGTLQTAGYEQPIIVNSLSDLDTVYAANVEIPNKWHSRAKREREQTIEQIKAIVMSSK
jgi:hypothetical protein